MVAPWLLVLALGNFSLISVNSTDLYLPLLNFLIPWSILVPSSELSIVSWIKPADLAIDLKYYQFSWTIPALLEI
jgi:hypothetical protein